MKIFISGPIRPTKNSVIECVKNAREQFPNSEIYLSVWDSNYENGSQYESEELKELSSLVEHFILSTEPSDDFIRENIINVSYKGNSTVQHLMTNTTWGHSAIYGIYRSHVGLKKIFDYIEENNLCKEDDICVRYRTDLIVKFSGNHISEISEEAKNNYLVYNSLCSGVNFNDWFAISNYKNMKTAWYFPKIEDVRNVEFDNYLHKISKSYNAESIIKNNLLDNNIEISYFPRVKFPKNVLDIYKIDESQLFDGQDGYIIEEIGIVRQDGLSHMP